MQVDRALLGRTSRRCAAPNCNRRSSFHYINAASGLFCGQHKLEGMINVRNKPCVQEGCLKQPCFNHPGKMPALFCYTHKVPGMVNVKQKACAEPECPNRPSFNHPGSGLALYCSKHRAKGMVDVRNKHCEHEGCPKAPCFNFPGCTPGVLCRTHRLEGMVDVKHKRYGPAPLRRSRKPPVPPVPPDAQHAPDAHYAGSAAAPDAVELRRQRLDVILSGSLSVVQNAPGPAYMPGAEPGQGFLVAGVVHAGEGVAAAAVAAFAATPGFTQLMQGVGPGVLHRQE